MSDARTVSAVIGANARRIREERGLRQEDVLHQARRYGLVWVRGTLAAVEHGERRLDVDEIPVLAYVLRCGLTDLLAGPAEQAVVVGRAEMFLGLVRQLLIGEGGYLLPAPLPKTARSSAGEEAVRKAARRLGVPALRVSNAAFHLYGRSLSDHRDALVEKAAGSDAPARTKQALRGHITRQLDAELRTYLEARREGFDV